MMKALIAMAGAALLAAPNVAQAPAQTPATPSAIPAHYGAPIGDEAAMALIDRAITLSAEKGLRLAIAVAEPSGELVAFARMDGVPYATIAIAQQKARTATRFRLPTAEFERRVQDGRIVLRSSDEVIAIGVPIVVDGKVIGALGVSGASAAEDAAMADLIVRGD
jgi:glc operon protein GlcG